MESYIIIPAQIRADQKLKPLEKLLLGEIITLSHKEGYCWASNAYLARTYGVSRRTIIRSLKILSDNGYVEIDYESENLDTKRKIRPIIGGDSLSQGVTPVSQGGDKSAQGGVTNLHPNNTSINNKNNNSRRPPLQEIENFFLESGKSAYQGKEFYEHMESRNWSYKDEPIQNWKAFANGWIRKLKPEPKIKALR